jgi:hypothetical protein
MAEPEQPMALPRRLRAAIKLAAPTIVPATVAFYVVGFVVSVPHFMRCGVPISALSPQTFVASGLLFAALAGLAIVAATGYSRTLSSASWVLQAIEGTVVFVLVPGAFLFCIELPLRRGQFYVVVVAVLLGLCRWPKKTVSRDGRPDLIATTLDVVRIGAAALALPALFARLLYPVIPVYYGGGRPEPLVSVSLGPPHEWPLPHDRWGLTACRTSPPLSGPERCRTVYRVHESQDYLYVAVVEVEGACPAKPAEWDSWAPWVSWPHVKAQPSGCFQRIANSEVRWLETPGTP